MDKQNDSIFPHPFWDFSLRVYGRDAVRRHCLALQDQSGADINLLLFLLWRARAGAAPPQMAEIRAMQRATDPVRAHAIEPLRALRRALKQPLPDDLPDLREALRQRILDAELAAEAMAQTVLYRQFPVPPVAEGGATDSPACAIALYLEQIGLPPEVAQSEAEALVAAVD